MISTMACQARYACEGVDTRSRVVSLYQQVRCSRYEDFRSLQNFLQVYLPLCVGSCQAFELGQDRQSSGRNVKTGNSRLHEIKKKFHQYPPVFYLRRFCFCTLFICLRHAETMYTDWRTQFAILQIKVLEVSAMAGTGLGVLLNKVATAL